jgi:hypothetical protein
MCGDSILRLLCTKYPNVIINRKDKCVHFTTSYVWKCVLYGVLAMQCLPQHFEEQLVNPSNPNDTDCS